MPCVFPLETGEKPPLVQRRAGLVPNTKAEVSQHPECQLCCVQRSCTSMCTGGLTTGCLWLQDEAAQRKQMKAIFSGALYRHSESDGNFPNSKRTVHRGCHTGTIAKHLKSYPKPTSKTTVCSRAALSLTIYAFDKRNTSCCIICDLRLVRCLSEDTVMSESTSSMSDSTSHDNGESPITNCLFAFLFVSGEFTAYQYS